MASRALPDLVSRLKIDASDLQKVQQQAQAMERGLKTASNSGSESLKQVEQATKNLSAGNAILRFGEDGKVSLDRLSSSSAKTRAEFEELSRRATAFGSTVSSEFRRGTTAVVNLAADGTASLGRVQQAAEKTEASSSRLGGGFVRVRQSIGGVATASLGLFGPLAGVTAGFGGIYEAVDQVLVPAAGFQQQMVKLVGTAGESRAALGSVSAGIEEMAGQVGYSSQQLADGMYLVESAGFHGAAGLNVLRQSAMAAKAENADMVEVANAVTTALNAYALGADQAAHVTDVLLTATAQGKMTFQDLAGSLDQILPVASAAHISLNEVAAAIATQTAQGTPAAVAATNLQYAIKGLEVPSSTASQAIEGLGAKSNRFANELVTKGLLPTLNDLTTLIGRKFPEGSAGYNAAISNILGNQEGLNAVLQLSGGHAKTFSDNLAGMGAAAGKTKSSFDEMMDTTGGKWSRFTAGLGADAIRLGENVLPRLDPILDTLVKLTDPSIYERIGRQFATLADTVQRALQPVLAQLAQMGSSLGGAFTRQTGLAGVAAVSPLGSVVALVVQGIQHDLQQEIQNATAAPREMAARSAAARASTAAIPASEREALRQLVAQSLVPVLATPTTARPLLTSLPLAERQSTRQLGTQALLPQVAGSEQAALAARGAAQRAAEAALPARERLGARQEAETQRALAPVGPTAAGGFNPAAIGAGLGEAVVAAARVVKATLDGMRQWWADHGKQVLAIVVPAFNAVRDVFFSAVNAIRAGIGPALATITGFWKEHGAEVGFIVGSMWTAVTAIFQAALPYLQIIVGGTFKILVDTVGSAFSLIGSIVRTAVDLFLGVIGIGLDLITGHWDKAGKDIVKLVLTLKDDVYNIFAALFGGLGKIFGDSFSTLGSIAHKAVDDLSGVFGGLGDGVKSGLNTVLDALQSFDRWVDNLPVIGGLMRLPTDIPHFATGAIVERPTLGVFGEAGPEALIPLDGGQRSIELWQQAGKALGLHGLGASTTPGSLGGQCVVYVEDVTGRHFDVTMASQMASLVNTQKAAPGEVFVSTLPPYGHVGFVIGAGKVLDSNWGLDQKIQIHNLSDIPDIAGYIAGLPAPGLPGGTFDVKGSLAGLANRALGGLGGWEGDLGRGVLSAIAAGLASRFDDGGVWPSGTLGVNTSGRNEYVLTPEQMGGRHITNHYHIQGATMSPAQIALAIDARIARLL